MRRTAISAVLLFALVFLAVAVAPTAAEPGVVDGYEPDDEFDFNRPIEGEQLEAVVSRTMARVEVIRNREFEGRPNVEIVGREDVPGANGGGVNRTAQGDWNDVVWEALLIVGEDEYANQAISDTVGGATAGFYDTGDGDGNGTANKTVSLVGRLHEPTLAHELVHVMQDQQYNLSAERFRPPVQDEQLASQGIVEGEAEYIRFVYEERCETEWECYERAATVGAGGGFEGNVGLLMTLIQPYSDGPEYVHRLHEEGDWEAVEDKYEDVPTTSSEIIRGEEPEAVEISFENEATEGWSLYDAGRNGYDVAGEASIFVTFWYQSAPDPLGHGHGVIDTSGFLGGRGEYARYDYRSEVSEGWRGDRIYPYHRETEGGNQTGFVWKSSWDTQEDAATFADAYLSVLDGHDAERIDGATRVVEGEFRGTYRVARDGRNVTVVRAPTVEGLNELRPSSSEAERPTGEPIDARPQPTPGFGFVVVLVALFSVVAVRLRART